ncbi:MAG TPA: serine hydrolase [Gemmatimonadaceae bacterium]|jgi:CubicO group peptidase (beta-lactamase class C family)|nr:serine hydrolase [Gemmatimonadaceae bacterium]
MRIIKCHALAPLARLASLASLVSLAAAGCASAQAAPAPLAPNAAFASADSTIEDWIARKQIPGAVLVVSHDGTVVHERAFGYAQEFDFAGNVLPNPRPMHLSTLFDLASVTKVMATTLGVMMLADRGKIDVDAPVYRYLPDFRGPHLDSITVRNLLTHSAGLVQWQPLYYHASNKAETYNVIRTMPLQWGVGEGRHYSDLGFMLLGYIVERVSGQSLDAFLAQALYKPLGLASTTFTPTAHGFSDFAATEAGNGYERHMVYGPNFGYGYKGDPTSWNGWRQYVDNGETNDGNSFYANGGVAGHAGLFSTASDVRVLMDLLMSRGTYRGTRYISASVIDEFLTVDRFKNYLGWMLPRGFPAGSFEHNGFTGTDVLGVPSERLSIVLLTNRQNVPADARGYFTNVGPLDDAVNRAIVDAFPRELKNAP